MNDTQILTSQELASRWKVSPKWIANHTRSADDPIPHVRLGRYVRFEDSEPLHKWFAKRRVNSPKH